jgi:hypothetical protein
MRALIPALFLLLLAGAGMIVALNGPERPDEVAGVAVNVPPDCLLEEGGEIPDEEAIRRLDGLARSESGRSRVGIHYRQGGRDLHLLMDRAEDVILLWSASGRTLVERRWNGNVAERMEWALEKGTFTVPGMMPPLERNLYH